MNLKKSLFMYKLKTGRSLASMALEMGITDTYLCKMLNGHRTLTPKYKKKICDFFLKYKIQIYAD
jgi:hypothetical protein